MHQLVPLILEKGQAAFFKTDVPKMLDCKYRAVQNKANKQPKVVFMLSTAHPAEMNATGKNDREGNAVHKPTMIRAYNVHMGGVDRVDQQLHSIFFLQKSYKWYKKLVLRLISQVILNGHKIFQKHTGYTGDFLSFLHIKITEL